VLCDVDPTTFDFVHEQLERIVDQDTLCVVPCHLWGLPADIERSRVIAARAGAWVVEDAAQAMGGVSSGRKLGTIGDVGFFSLGRGKNITCGSGGIIMTNSDPLGDAIGRRYAELPSPSWTQTLAEWLRVVAMACLIHPRLYWLPAGLPMLKLGETVFPLEFPIQKLSAMHATLLGQWERHLAQSNLTRSDHGAYFEERLGLRRATGGERASPYLRFPVLARDGETRDALVTESRRRGLGVSIMYPKAVHQAEEIRAAYPNLHGSFPLAEAIAARLLALPTHQYVSRADREAIGALLAPERVIGYSAQRGVTA
jgi:dTDP-4-amino-4,6-dideoxygalactose transaminase